MGILFFTCIFANSYGQNSAKDSISGGKQEIKLNLAMAIAGVPEITYEYFLEDNSSVGLSMGVGLDKPEDLSLRFIVTPYYRLFFGKKNNAGFFIEANAAVASYRDVYTYVDYIFDENGNYQFVESEVFDEKSTNFGMGAAVGFKLLTRNNYVGELYAGVGRLFGDSNDIEVYPRVGVSIGKRF